MPDPQAVARVQQIKARYERELMRKPNVVGVGVGFCERGGRRTDEVCLVVSVRKKVPLDQLEPRDVIPRELDGIPVDVQATGQFHAR